jgi:DNA/RNA endonuclease G (NUC1)
MIVYEASRSLFSSSRRRIADWLPMVPLLMVFGALAFMTMGLATRSDTLPISDDTKNGIIACNPVIEQRHNPDLVETDPQEAIWTDGPKNEKPFQLVCFSKYLSSFDTRLVEVGPERFLRRAVPNWVVHHVPQQKTGIGETHGRPSGWYTIPALAKDRIAPTDDSYRSSMRFLNRNGNWFQRGHLAQKYLAERDPLDDLVAVVGLDRAGPGWFTHNVANAVPQRGRFNRGPWLALECYSGAWANTYKNGVYVITGPIFINGRPTEWLRSDNRPRALPVAVPDALFKVILRNEGDKWESLAFIYPQDDPSYRRGPWNPAKWLTSVAQVEKLAGIKVRPTDAAFKASKVKIPERIWHVERENFDPSCRRFAPKEGES